MLCKKLPTRHFWRDPGSHATTNFYLSNSIFSERRLKSAATFSNPFILLLYYYLLLLYYPISLLTLSTLLTLSLY